LRFSLKAPDPAVILPYRVKARPDHEPLFSILDGLRPDVGRCYRIERCEAQADNCDPAADTGQINTGVEIQLPMSDKRCISNEGYMLKSEIAQ